MKTRSLSILLAALAVVAFVPAVEGATKYVSISPTALQPMGGSFAGIAMTSLPFLAGDTSFYFTLDTSTFDDAIMFAPLDLPDKKALRTLWVYFTRNTGDGDIYITVYLTRHSLAAGTFQNLGAIYTWSSAASPARRALSIALKNNVVDNSKYTYALTVGFSRPVSALKFHGAKISYTE